MSVLNMKFIIGIDEVGRGPLAGPVAVGAVSVKSRAFDKKFWKGIKDSKKLSEKDRELWFKLATRARRRGEIDWAVSLISEKVIDKNGIVYAINLGIKRCLTKVSATEDSQIFLDGGIKAPERFKRQTTVVKGDEKIPVISLASIVAKVTRDRAMLKCDKKYPGYGLAQHKGYGTKMHCQKIRKYGSTKLHRQTFIKRLTK